jgi:hypothetical protein
VYDLQRSRPPLSTSDAAPPRAPVDARSFNVMAVEPGARVQSFPESAFRQCTLASLHIPSSVQIMPKSACMWFLALQFVPFEIPSTLDRIEEAAFRRTGLNSIVLPSSITVLGKSCFELCKSLTHLSFEDECKLKRVEERAFASSGLIAIAIPACSELFDLSALDAIYRLLSRFHHFAFLTYYY